MNTDEVLIEEYKLTQTVINHYERLIWYIGSILNGSVMVLAGLAMKESRGKGFLVVVGMSAFASFAWYQLECRFRSINMQKFRRLWEIEGTLGFKQNVYVKDHDQQKKYISGHMIITSICVAIPSFLLAYWLFAFFGA